MIKRVYIAGPLTPAGLWDPHPAIDYIFNIRSMLRVGIEVYFAGFTPFLPCLDFFIFLLLREGEKITEDMIKRYSRDWMETCDAVVLCPGWRKSKGTDIELRLAGDRGIPVFESVEELVKFEERVVQNAIHYKRKKEID